MARIFISHSSRDAAHAATVNEWLVTAGHEAFLDQDLRAGIALGEEWQQRLHERLRWADAVVCLISAAYVGSTWCAAEVGIAQSRGSRLMPVHLEEDVSHPLLTGVQHVDLGDDADVARATLLEALRGVDAIGGCGWSDDRSPFPGLRPFESDQSRAFFGRSAEVNGLAEMLRSPAEAAVLLVVGPSGCGKSSLVRAGLLPLMAAERGWWTLAPILPGANPIHAFVGELAAAAHTLGLRWSIAEARRRVETDGLADVARELLLAAPPPRRRRLLVVVDQFEELLTQTPPPQRARLAELLRPALGGPVQVVATLRPEFLDQVLVSPELAGLPTHTFTLRPLSRDGLATVVSEPARMAGLAVDDDLVAQLVSDTDTDSGDALPLLAYTLAELSAGLGRGDRLLRSRYEQLGGVRGSLTRQANAALDEAVAHSGRSRDDVVRGLLRLVTVDEHGYPTRWRVHRAELPAALMAELEPFVARRLLTTDADDSGTVVEVSHEAFLTAWPPLAEAIEANSAALRARRGIEQAATVWAQEGHTRSRLWERGQLAAALADTGARFQAEVAQPNMGEAGPAKPTRRPSPMRRRALVTERVELSPRARTFLQTSIRRDQRRRRRSTAVLSTLLAVALLAAGLAVLQLHAAEQRQRLATARLLMAQADAALATSPRTALLLGEAAFHVHPAPETESHLVETLRGSRYTAQLTGHTQHVETVAYAPGGQLLASAGGDRSVILWDLADPDRPRRLSEPLTGHRNLVTSVAFSPDGRVLASGSWDDTVILWDLSDPSRPRQLGVPLSGHAPGVGSVAFSADGRILAVEAEELEGSTVVLWDVADPLRPQRLGELRNTNSITSNLAFAPNKQSLAVGDVGGALTTWDLTDPLHPRPSERIDAHGGLLNGIAFTPDGNTLATAGWDNNVIFWDMTDANHPKRLGEPLPTGHRSYVSQVAFSPDGQMMATGGWDTAAFLWDVRDRTRPGRMGGPLTGHTDSVSSMAFAPDGRTLATGSGDASVILWSLTEPGQPDRVAEPLIGHNEPIQSLALAANGRTLATGAGDRTVLLWDLTDPGRPRRLGEPLAGHTGIVNSAAFAPDPVTLATGDMDGTVILWDVTDPKRPQRRGPPLAIDGEAAVSVAFAPFAPVLVTASQKAVVLWDVSNLATPRRLGDLRYGEMDRVEAMAISPDGRTLAVTDREAAVPPQRAGTLRLWDVSDPSRPRLLNEPLTGHGHSVSAVAFAPDGRTLATGAVDNTMLLWDLTDPDTPRPIGQPVSGSTGYTALVVFTPDGDTLASSIGEHSVVLWDLTRLNRMREHPLERACAITGGGLRPEEWARMVPGLAYEDPCDPG